MSETYHSALQMAGEALQGVGVHPFRAQNMKYAFVEMEQAEDEKLYQSWLNEEENRAFTQHYHEIFMKLEELLANAFNEDRADGHTKGERGWTPPPKDYLDDFK